MKRRWGGALLLVVAFAACGKTSAPPQPTPTSSTTNFKAKASAVVDAMAAGHSVAVESNFDATMKSQLPVEKLVTAWTEFLAIEGGYRSHGTATEVKLGDVTVERVPVTMGKASGEVRVSYNADGTIGGLYFLKAGAPPP